MIEWAYIISFLLMSSLVWITAYNRGYGDGLTSFADEIKREIKNIKEDSNGNNED